MRSTQPDLRGGGRVIRGSVTGAGVIVSGTGFTVVRVGVGNYTITFHQPFKAPPEILLTGNSGGNSQRSLDISASSAAAFTFWVFSVGAATDEPFNFVATEAVG